MLSSHNFFIQIRAKAKCQFNTCVTSILQCLQKSYMYTKIKDQTNGAHLRTYYLVADDDDDDDDMKKRLLNLVVKLFACSN